MILEQSLVAVLFWLLVGHAVADFALQSEWMVRTKNAARRRARGAGRRDLIWVHVLSAHALIHGGAVALATGMVWLGIAETIAHWAIDYGKAQHLYNFHIDQFMHLGCKLVWALCWLAMV